MGIGEDDEVLDESVASANVRTRVRARLQSSVDKQLPADIATIPDELNDPYVEELVQMVKELDEVNNDKYLEKRINKVENVLTNKHSGTHSKQRVNLSQ